VGRDIAAAHPAASFALKFGMQCTAAQRQSIELSETRAMKVYISGPLGFSDIGRLFHNQVLVPTIRGLGYQVLDPWTLTDQAKIDAVQKMPFGPSRRDAWRGLNVEMGSNNRRAIDDCDLVFAVLDGVDVDSGTASEIGYAFAKGKPILGYRGDFRLSADNEGSTVNLQVEYFIRESGGEIISTVAAIAHALAKIKDQALRRTH
jgi:nucleoside 2-deoxyribosyltransferase